MNNKQLPSFLNLRELTKDELEHLEKHKDIPILQNGDKLYTSDRAIESYRLLLAIGKKYRKAHPPKKVKE